MKEKRLSHGSAMMIFSKSLDEDVPRSNIRSLLYHLTICYYCRNWIGRIVVAIRSMAAASWSWKRQ